MLGIDMASVDGNTPPNWKLAQKAGINFAILRASFSLYSRAKKTRIIMPDPTFQRDWAKIPMVRGAYMFPEMRATASPEDQVAVFASAVEHAGGLTHKDLPPVLDIEYPDGVKDRKVALEWMIRAATALKETYEIWPMLYTSARVWDGDDKDTLNADTMMDIAGVLKECPLWLARYPYKLKQKAVLTPPEGHPPVPKMWGVENYWLWQYQGDALKTPGFSNTVDLNKFNYMKPGDQGKRVEWVQKRLGVKIDGDFGNKTLKALEGFQAKNKLGADGVVGPGTFAMLSWVK